MDINWDVDYYVREDGSMPVKEFLASLPDKLGAKILWEIHRLVAEGINLREPYAAPIKGAKYKGLWELKVKQGSDIARVFYFLPIGHTFILLHGFAKKTNKTPKQELETARRYMEDYRRRFVQ